MLTALSACWWVVVSQLQRTARAEAKMFALLLDAAPEAILGVGDSGAIRFANARVPELFGFSEAELLDQSIEKLIPDRLSADHGALRARYIRAPRPRPMGRASALVAKRKDGTEFPVEVSLNRIPSDRGPVVLCVVRDVTEQSRTRQALIEANRELESTVAAMRRRAGELQELTDLGELLQSCVSEREIYPLASAALERLFPGIAGGLYLLNSSRIMLELAGSWSCSQEQLASNFAPQDCWALRRSRAHRCASADSRLRCAHAARQPGEWDSLCIPMTAHGETIGVLCAWRRRDSDEDPTAFDQVFRAIAEQCALATANLRLREVLRNQSIRDPLTDLFNRRFLEEWLERELYRAARQGSSLSVLMVDFDHFKRFNDTFGHPCGDNALRESCLLLRRVARNSDVVCRIGGEEIAVLLPDTPLRGALQVAEELRAAIERNLIRRESHTLGSLTISIGVACSPEHGRSSDTLLQAADVALYAAKQEGRNRVVSAARPDLKGKIENTTPPDSNPSHAVGALKVWSVSPQPRSA